MKSCYNMLNDGLLCLFAKSNIMADLDKGRGRRPNEQIKKQKSIGTYVSACGSLLMQAICEVLCTSISLKD